MAWEIERRFLVRGRPWEGLVGERILQAYIAETDGRTVRVRRRGPGATVTVKGPTTGATRAEFEIPIAPELADEMIAVLAPPGRITKIRYELVIGPHTWEIDVYDGLNEGLVVAEVELSSESEHVDLPDWVTTEVTHDGRYTNAALAARPWCQWDKP